MIKFLYHIVEVVTVADLDVEKCGADLEAEVWSYFFRLSAKSDQDSEVEVQARFWS